MRISDVVIGGGGIIGLSLALELAEHGFEVTVLELGAAMREASWAAAGMLAARDPENPPQLRALSELSLALYPGFLEKVERLSGCRVPLRTALTLQGSGRDAAVSLSAEELQRLVPDLRPGTRVFSALDEQSLDPRDLCAALPLAVREAGVTLVEHTRVQGVTGERERVCVATDAGRSFSATHYVHCCGAWSGAGSGGAAFEVCGSVEPRKGQMLTVTLPEQAPVLGCVLRTPELYLVPRDAPSNGGGQRIVIGATVERAGFDCNTTKQAAEELLAAAAELWPPIRLGAVTEHWAGLRPWAPDALPIVSRLEATSGSELDGNKHRCWVATAHFRNGILLAPGTARVLRQLMTGEEPKVDLDPFRASRFAAVATAS